MTLRVALAMGVSVAVVGMAAPDAAAAVRVCKAPVSSGLATDVSEPGSRRKALSAWVANAKSAGAQNPSWRLASNKILKCARIATGQFDCIARAEPCSISQAAPGLPRRGIRTKEKPIAI